MIEPLSPPSEPKKYKISTSLRMLNEKMDDLKIILENGNNREIQDNNEKELRSQLIANDAAHNLYSSTKSVGQQFLNISVITNYIQILVSISSLPISDRDIGLIVLISISLINQGLIFVIVTILYKATNDQISRNCTATMLNNLVTTLTALTVITNIPITVLISTKTSSNNTISVLAK